MKKRKRVLKSIVLIILTVIILCGALAAPTLIDGYKMYKTAVTQKPIDAAIDEIRSGEDYVKLDNISKDFLQQVVASEDRRFYNHCGIDIISITRAAYCNAKAGSLVEGGSTITQQLAKNMYFSFKKSYIRKVAEMFAAFDLERALTKDEILELYCNVAYFGQGCYGIKEASLYYYDVAPENLSDAQTAALVFTLRSPENNNPNVK